MNAREKYAKKYARMFANAMKEIGRNDSDVLHDAFRTRYLTHLNSPEFAEYSRYKTIALQKVYCAITHAQICLELGYTLEEAQWIWEKVLSRKFKKLFNRCMALIDALPNGYKIVAGWLYKDAKARIAENCLTFELLDYSDKKLEYKITRCAYVEIFEHYGIRNFAKVFCNSDLCMEVMHRHAKFVRYSDLVDGPCCHDAVIKVDCFGKSGADKKK